MGTLWAIVLGVIILALVYVFFNYRKIKFLKEGTDEMVEMAGIIRSGANTFMKTEYKTIFIVVLVVALIFSLFVEKTSGITLILGAIASSAACVTGMKSATYANVRTSNKARESLSIGVLCSAVFMLYRRRCRSFSPGFRPLGTCGHSIHLGY